MKTEIYKGHTIVFQHGFYWTLGTMFKTMKAAKTIIDELIEN
jgi:hypothetical protein